MAVRKYLNQLHGSTPTDFLSSLSLPPDVHLQCGEACLQLCEDPFEAKLRANYEVNEAEIVATCTYIYSILMHEKPCL